MPGERYSNAVTGMWVHAHISVISMVNTQVEGLSIMLINLLGIQLEVYNFLAQLNGRIISK